VAADNTIDRLEPFAESGGVKGERSLRWHNPGERFSVRFAGVRPPRSVAGRVDHFEAEMLVSRHEEERRSCWYCASLTQNGATREGNERKVESTGGRRNEEPPEFSGGFDHLRQSG